MILPSLLLPQCDSIQNHFPLVMCLMTVSSKCRILLSRIVRSSGKCVSLPFPCSDPVLALNFSCASVCLHNWMSPPPSLASHTRCTFPQILLDVACTFFFSFLFLLFCAGIIHLRLVHGVHECSLRFNPRTLPVTCLTRGFFFTLLHPPVTDPRLFGLFFLSLSIHCRCLHALTCC